METPHVVTTTIKKVTLILWLSMLLMVVFVTVGHAQDDYSKLNRRHQHAYYRENESRLSHACHILGRKRSYVPHKSIFASHHRSKSSGAEVASSTPALSTPKVAATKPVVKKEVPEVKPAPVEHKAEVVSEKKLETLHHNEDNVLASNKLPVPTSQKHDEVRKRVAEELKKKPVTEPLQLAPLYFQFNQDEFSVVDMEPFLVAVEYALQGHTVLIEGHTDSRGNDDYNVKLSVKRVQRIRQLMLDMGVPDERISVIGYGEELVQDKKKTKSEEEHQNNRRVDFTVF